MRHTSTWVDSSSPHARIVWRSHFPSFVQKYLWYALTPNHVLGNLRPVLWGVGAKGYPKSWWRGHLVEFFRMTCWHRIPPPLPPPPHKTPGTVFFLFLTQKGGSLKVPFWNLGHLGFRHGYDGGGASQGASQRPGLWPLPPFLGA